MLGKQIHLKNKFFEPANLASKTYCNAFNYQFSCNEWTSAFNQSRSIYADLLKKDNNIYNSKLKKSFVTSIWWHLFYSYICFWKHFSIKSTIFIRTIKSIMGMPWCLSSALKFCWDLHFASGCLAKSYNKLFIRDTVINMNFLIKILDCFTKIL